jgi:enoyl-CoA hydratase/carnithine racemase
LLAWEAIGLRYSSGLCCAGLNQGPNMNDELLFDLQDGVALITINRADHYNTMSIPVIEGLGEAYRRCDEDDDVRAVVLTGAGSVFCTGADMSGGGATFDSAEQVVEINSQPLAMQAFEVRKPVIAACNGHAVGAGMGLALQADMRLVANEGKYGFLQARRGVITDFAAEYLLPRLVGFERAFELLVRANRLTGEEAVAWGLASRALPAQEVLPAALEIAADIAANCAPLVVAMHKRMLWRALDMPLQELAHLETRALNYTMTKPDAVEGGVAYFEKRAPQWSGSVANDWPEWMA